MSAMNTLSESQLQSNSSSDTRIYPLIQMGIVSIDQEFEYLKNLLSNQVCLLSDQFNSKKCFVGVDAVVSGDHLLLLI